MVDEHFAEEVAQLLRVERSALDERLRQSIDNWDSLEVLGLIALIDEQYAVTVPAADLVRCDSMARLAQLIGTARG